MKILHIPLLLTLCAAGLWAQARPDLPLCDFECARWADIGWKTEGDAFGQGPARGALGRQMPVSGFEGEALANSFFDGSDRATGKLISPDFKLERNYLNFRIGGGGWKGTYLVLFADGAPVATASGTQIKRGGSEALKAVHFDIAAHAGKTARVEIVDAERGPWGHITADAFVQSDTPLGDVARPATQANSAGIAARIRALDRVRVAPDAPDYAAAVAAAEALVGREGLTLVDQERAARALRARLQADPYRPAYHVLPPEGNWNDVNGALYHNGRYHLFFLGREAPTVPEILSGQENAFAREIWLHASSADLLHWVWHPTALNYERTGAMPRGIYSGGAVAGAEKPTLIYHVPAQGTCISVAEDDDLIRWKPLAENPVITAKGQHPDVQVFDPAAWKEGDVYYALVGNKSNRKGYEGDTPSLFKSKDLIHWEYLHPFYKSSREWTHVDEDAACPDFFPIDNGKHMLVTHVHNPMFGVQYYIGTWKDEVFTPEQHGRMSVAGGCLSGPETMRDGQGRRLFFGWVRELKPARNGWASMVSLPRVLSLADDNSLRITPPEELKRLRTNETVLPPAALAADAETPLEKFAGNVKEIALDIDIGTAKAIVLTVLRSADGREQTRIVYDPAAATLTADSAQSSLDPAVRYTRYSGRYAQQHGIPAADVVATAQTLPLALKKGEPLRLRVFIDRSIIEVFANDVQCLTQRVYPTLPDSLGVSIKAEGGDAHVRDARAWDIAPTNPW